MTALRPLRPRTDTGQPPAETTHDLLGMTGREILQGTIDGRFPSAPILSALGFRLAQVGHGTVVFEGEPGDQSLGPAGGMYGGFMATLLESALSAAVLTRLASGTRSTSVKIGIDIHRAVRGDARRLRCTGTAIHVGSTTASAEARLIGAEDGELYAQATSMYAILRML
ncbi:PaaI family thioesterase [Nocardia beijingensis]|uniref:PaaI family thioesterase n=1 Tax=Nocardia beijingensis TaxID=95162 RepID=UPI001893EF68|nr:PaaI family thioesterase [Nocardia beijingensis]MBF6469118.1 PaaI family thioesterase [Nocardia beijingensis]